MREGERTGRSLRRYLYLHHLPAGGPAYLLERACHLLQKKVGKKRTLQAHEDYPDQGSLAEVWET